MLFGPAANSLFASVAGVAVCECGCAIAASIPSPPVGPQAISVTVTPSGGSVMLGNQIPFSATVKNSSDSTVSWSVNGVAGGTAKTGTVTSGTALQVDYGAPAAAPIPNPVTVQAVSIADATKSGASRVTIINHVLVTVLAGPHCKDVWRRLWISALPFERGPDQSGLRETTLREVRFMSVENPETKSSFMALFKSQTPGDGMLQIWQSENR
jgi:hypothetical protein